MNKTLMGFLTGVLVTLSAPVTSAGIIVMPNVQELLNGGSITVLDKVFSDWELLDENNSVQPINWSDVNVDRLDDDSLDPGLAFLGNGEFSGQHIDFELQFTVTTLDGSARIKDLSMELKDFYASTSGTVMSVNTFALDTDAPGAIIISNLEPYRFDSENFTPVPGTRVLMHLNIGDPNSSISRFDVRVSQIPEPGTLALMGIGLAGLGFIGRRIRQPETE